MNLNKGSIMEQITIRIKDRKKAQALLEFLRSLDFVESVSRKDLLDDKKSNGNQEKDFFELAGIWIGRDISLKTIREKAWPYRT
jgi:hypothetical protein